jgi:outer membrane biogenesis lipoprotein LolB
MSTLARLITAAIITLFLTSCTTTIKNDMNNTGAHNIHKELKK